MTFSWMTACSKAQRQKVPWVLTHQNEHFFGGGGGTTPLKNEISTFQAKPQTFYAMNMFFSLPRVICINFGPHRTYLTRDSHF